MDKFIVASHNKKKLAELTRILKPMGFDVICPSDIEGGIPEEEENGSTFEENALIKARSACKFTGLPAVADDSGLCVDALNGAPGIYSARFAGTGKDSDNNALLLAKLQGVTNRSASFVSCIACVFPDGREFTVKGECKGEIAGALIGDGGFGYDPLFLTEWGCFGTMTAEQKDKVSHRARAIEKFKEKLVEFI
ncbi:MAG: RdgB/HAM1 family non-canonical purine NTP pyrophosphatase [Ruminococcaceae bacterium]|nr:RdgB/HAM1 family non-canonical purine NTP pyrophosphatase [Oscillospiraceae bacterium]